MTRFRNTSFVLTVTFVVIFGSLSAYALGGSATPVPAVNTSDSVGLKGYDPVAYFILGAPTSGADEYAYRWKNVTYKFSSAENQARFKADPEKYLPQYGGYCAYAMSLDRIADIDPHEWAIVDGKLYLNNGVVAQSLWSLNKSGNIVSGDRNWQQYPKNAE